ncbi:hypothetical protein PO124_15185 [Bacillus licheniformis]|nr:hypothetical protein [Bacillus licheniformis]
MACKRIRSGKHVSLYSKDVKEIMNHKEYEVARAIVRTLEQSCTWRFQKRNGLHRHPFAWRERTVMAAIRSGAIESMMDEEETDRLTQLIMKPSIKIHPRHWG